MDILLTNELFYIIIAGLVVIIGLAIRDITRSIINLWKG